MATTTTVKVQASTRDLLRSIVLQPDWLSLSTWVVAFTSMSARPASFRPTVIVADNETLVMCNQLATLDLTASPSRPAS